MDSLLSAEYWCNSHCLAKLWEAINPAQDHKWPILMASGSVSHIWKSEPSCTSYKLWESFQRWHVWGRLVHGYALMQQPCHHIYMSLKRLCTWLWSRYPAAAGVRPPTLLGWAGLGWLGWLGWATLTPGGKLTRDLYAASTPWLAGDTSIQQRWYIYNALTTLLPELILTLFRTQNSENRWSIYYTFLARILRHS